MKKMIAMMLSVVLFASLLPLASAEAAREIEYLPDGSYYVTTIEDESPGLSLLSSSATKSKRKTYYDADGTARWYVKVTGTFTYGNGSSKCTASSVSAKSYVSYWKIVKKSASRKGNKATATATAEQTRSSGESLSSITRSVTLTCSPTGEFS